MGESGRRNRICRNKSYVPLYHPTPLFPHRRRRRSPGPVGEGLERSFHPTNKEFDTMISSAVILSALELGCI